MFLSLQGLSFCIGPFNPVTSPWQMGEALKAIFSYLVNVAKGILFSKAKCHSIHERNYSFYYSLLLTFFQALLVTFHWDHEWKILSAATPMDRFCHICILMSVRILPRYYYHELEFSGIFQPDSKRYQKNFPRILKLINSLFNNICWVPMGSISDMPEMLRLNVGEDNVIPN